MKDINESISLYTDGTALTGKLLDCQIFDDSGEYCGCIVSKNEKQISLFDNKGRFNGYIIKNDNGNAEKYNSAGEFQGYVKNGTNIEKYDKNGHFCGYYIAKNNKIEEYSADGKLVRNLNFSMNDVSFISSVNGDLEAKFIQK